MFGHDGSCMEINLDELEPKIVFLVGGNRIEMRRPKLREVKAIGKSQEGLALNDERQFQILSDLLETLGLPKAVFDELTPGQMEKITSMLLGELKKN